MFLVMDLAPNDGASTERTRASPSSDGSTTTTSWQQSSFLRLAYAKARSMTGVSLTPTDASSISSVNVDPLLDTLDVENQASQPGTLEDIEEIFYECRSQAASQTSLASLVDHDHQPDDHLQPPPPPPSPVVGREEEIVTYANGMCVYADGTPATQAPPGHCVAKVSSEFEEFYDYDLKKAKKMWEAMLKWREENEIWKIHRRPNLHFHIAKKYYPSCYHGVDKEDAVVEFSFPGRMDPHKLFPTTEALDLIMKHHMFMQEYLFNCLYTDEESWRQLGKRPLEVVPGESTTWGIVLVIDAKDCGINLLSGNVFTFIKRMIHNSTSYYPEMVKRLFIINSPFWVAGVFQTIRPLLPDAMEVEIVSEKDSLKVLREHINDDQIPVEYGGSSPYPLNQHPFERRLHKKVEEAAKYSREDAASTSTLIRKHSQDDTADTGASEDSGSCEGTSAKEFVLSAAAEMNFSDRDRLDRICASMEEEHILSTWQLQHLDASEWKTLGFPLGLASAIRRKVAESTETDPYEDDSIESNDLTPSPPCFNPFAVTSKFWSSITRGFEGCRR